MLTVLFAGSVLAYPVTLLTGLEEGTTFNDIAIRTTQVIGLLFALAYLHFACPLSRETLGWRTRIGNGPGQLARGFIAGVLIVSALVASLYLLDIHALIPGRDYSAAAITLLLVKALAAGLAVAVFEETLFRGALLGGLLNRTRHAASAVFAVSAAYAAVHFLDYPPLTANETVNWLTGPTKFAEIIINMFKPETLDAFLALFTLGLLLGVMRLRSGNIILCIGVHAGIVATIKISRYFLAYREGSGLDFLVSVHDHRLGYLAFLWLVIAILVYYVSGKMNQTIKKEHSPA